MEMFNRIQVSDHHTLYLMSCSWCQAITREKLRDRDPGDPQRDHIVKCHDCGQTANLRLLIKAYEQRRAFDQKLRSDHARNTGDPHHA